jgi:hypothetical protein
MFGLEIKHNSEFICNVNVNLQYITPLHPSPLVVLNNATKLTRHKRTAAIFLGKLSSCSSAALAIRTLAFSMHAMKSYH